MPASWRGRQHEQDEEQQHRHGGLQADVVVDDRALAVDEVRERRRGVRAAPARRPSAGRSRRRPGTTGSSSRSPRTAGSASSSGSVTLQNRRMPPAPSTTAASCRSRGMPCSPAVTRMNVKPRPAQTVDMATEGRAVSGSSSRPGDFTTGKRSSIHDDVGEHAHRRLQQEQPHQAGDGHRRGDRRREDGAEDADAPQVLVGQDGHGDAEADAERHGQQGELHRHPAGRPGTPGCGPRRRTGPTRWTGSCRPGRRSGPDPATPPGPAGRA